MDRHHPDGLKLCQLSLQAVRRPSIHRDSQPYGLDRVVYGVGQSLLEGLLQLLVTTVLHREQEWCLGQKPWQEEQPDRAACFQSVATLHPAGFWLPHSTMKAQAHCLKVSPAKPRRHFLRQLSHCVYREVEQLLDGASSEGFSRTVPRSLRRQNSYTGRSGTLQVRQVEADSDA